MKFRNLARKVLNNCICFQLDHQFSESNELDLLDDIDYFNHKSGLSLALIIVCMIYSSIKWEKDQFFRRFFFRPIRREGGERAMVQWPSLYIIRQRRSPGISQRTTSRPPSPQFWSSFCVWCTMCWIEWKTIFFFLRSLFFELSWKFIENCGDDVFKVTRKLTSLEK